MSFVKHNVSKLIKITYHIRCGAEQFANLGLKNGISEPQEW